MVRLSKNGHRQLFKLQKNASPRIEKVARRDKRGSLSEEKVTPRDKKGYRRGKEVALSRKEVARRDKRSSLSEEKVARRDKRGSLSEKKVAPRDKKGSLSEEKVTPRDKKGSLRGKEVAPSGEKVVTSGNALFFLQNHPILTFPYEGKERANTKCRNRNPASSPSKHLHLARGRLEGGRQLCMCSGGFVAANNLSAIAVRGSFSALNSEGARTALSSWEHSFHGLTPMAPNITPLRGAPPLLRDLHRFFSNM